MKALKDLWKVSVYAEGMISENLFFRYWKKRILWRILNSTLETSSQAQDTILPCPWGLLSEPHFAPSPQLSVHGEGNGSPLQCSCLENFMDRGAWWATVHRIAKSDTTEWLTLTSSYVFIELSPLLNCFHTHGSLCLLHPAHLLWLSSAVTSSKMPFLTPPPFSSRLEQLFLKSSLCLVNVLPYGSWTGQGWGLRLLHSVPAFCYSLALGGQSRIWMRKCGFGNVSF